VLNKISLDESAALIRRADREARRFADYYIIYLCMRGVRARC